MEQLAKAQSDSTASQQIDKGTQPNFDSHRLLGETPGLAPLRSESESALKHLPSCKIFGQDCALGKAAINYFDRAAHALHGDSAALAVGNAVLDVTHAAKAAADLAVIQADKILALSENGDSKLTTSGQVVLGDMRNLGLSESDIWNGSNVLLSNPADHGALYNKWRSLPAAKVGPSAHDGGQMPQYRIKTGPGDACVLFGVAPDGNTFFQMERNDVGSGKVENIKHGIDFLTYRATGRNVGPAGLSPHTDKNPIIR